MFTPHARLDPQTFIVNDTHSVKQTFAYMRFVQTECSNFNEADYMDIRKAEGLFGNGETLCFSERIS